MAKTARQVITKALRRLNYIPLGSEADGDSYQEALEDYEVFHDWGRQHFPRKWSWSSDAVDDRYWTHVSGMLAGRLAMQFPVSDKARERALANAQASERFLRQQFKTRIDTVEADYF